jgi:hypothetical protein
MAEYGAQLKVDDASGSLYTIATVSMSFPGLPVLTVILRQMLGGSTTKFDR